MKLNLPRSQPWLRRLLGGTRGRPVALAALLVFVLVQTVLALPRAWQATLPRAVAQTVRLLGKPLQAAQLGLFDAYQSLSPRAVLSQPVTIVAIDEKSLASSGQWPWPRDQLAALVHAVQKHEPAAIGLDFYMPEADQNSPNRLADRLQPDQYALSEQLRALPTSDAQLAQTLRDAPVVLGAAGFAFDTYTTSEALLGAALVPHGDDPRPFVQAYPRVLASLPILQAAAHGQGLLSIDTGGSSVVRRMPLLARINTQLVPSFGMEMLRVATGSSAIEVQAQRYGVTVVEVADLAVPTQPEGDIWLHYAPLSAGQGRYVSAFDVLHGTADPAQLRGKLVLVGLTGSGLNDVRTTALHELVPGVEIQAQFLESLFDRSFLRRPLWMAALEPLLVLGIGLALVWYLPQADRPLARQFKAHPRWAMGFAALTATALLALGLAVFSFAGLLFDAAGVAIGLTLVLGTLIASAVLDSLGDAQRKLVHLVESGLAAGREHQREGLLRVALNSARHIGGCEAAVIYLTTPEHTLSVAAQQGIDAASLADFSLARRAVEERRALKVECLDSSAQAHRLEHGHEHQPSIPAGTPAAVRSALAVPLMPREGQVLGLILLINAIDPLSRNTVAFDERVLPFIEALAAQTAIGLDNQNLVQAQNALMESIIKLIAGAIDAKSPYTGGHCERVPELAMMLARAACEVKEGPLASFDFHTDEEWREFRIGAWLHDCGKVTTPEYVVDKATKLETLYNRIHEIRTRFEVLLRDAEIECLRDTHERGVGADEARQRLAQRSAQLKDDFAFLASCNVGGEFLAPEHIERIVQIGQQTWLRHFDDRLGLSNAELQRLSTSEAAALPAQETLLADKPDHIIHRTAEHATAVQDGFKLKVPEHLFNLGEVHNLRISRGTLTDEERYKINEHIVQTILMLEQLPLPANLRRVPEYAGTHHETLTGTGYPRQLREDELSIPARIMAIADIFEALTASDRPYKKAKTLTESIKILSFFKKDRHIDPLLFDLFLSSGVYLEYAKRYLQPEQIDEVDIAKYLG